MYIKDIVKLTDTLASYISNNNFQFKFTLKIENCIVH